MKVLCRARSGFLLPLVLIIVVMVSLVLYYFHVVALSEYSQVHKIAYNYQLDLIVDSALIEMGIQQEKQSACQGTTPPPWVDEVIDTIEGARPPDPDDPRAPVGEPSPPAGGQGGPEGITLGGPVDVDAGRTLPGTDEVTRGSGNEPGTLVIKTTIGPFKHVPAEYDAKSVYAEPVFEDRKKDVVAWHLRGPIKVEARLKPAGRAFSGELVSTWNGTVAVTDATPVASDFVLFAYQPPTCEDEDSSIDQAINDLQRGGRFSVHARKVGRVLVRGPFLLLPEDAAPEKPYLTDRNRGAGDHAPSFSYVDSKWKGWSAVPGPRALLPPPLALGNGLVKWALDKLHALWDKIPTIGEVEALRPKRMTSPTFKIGPFDLPHFCVNLGVKEFCSPKQLGPWETPPISLVVGASPTGGDPAADIGAWWSILPDDEVGRFATGMYFHGLRKPGEQTFSIFGRTQDPPAGPGEDTVHDVFRGVRFKASEDQPPFADYSQGLDGLLVGDGDDNEVVLPEPVPRVVDGKTPDLGIIAHVGVAIFDAQTLFDINVIELVTKLIPGPGWAMGMVIPKILNAIGLNPGVFLVLRKWKVRGYDLPDDPENLTAEKVAEVFENALPDNIDADDSKPMGIVSPYGMYQYAHSINSWNRIRESLLNLGTKLLVNKAVSFGTKSLEKIIGWLLKGVGNSRIGTFADQMKAIGGDFVKNNALLNAIASVGRKFWYTLFQLVLRNKVNPGMIANILKGQARGRAQDFLKGKIRDPNGFLPRPVKALLGVFGPDAVDHPFKARFDAAMDRTKGLKEMARSYPYGFLPPKYSSWASLATRIYPDMQAYLDAEVVDGVLPLRGIVLLRELDYKGEPIKYRGAGIIVVVTKDESKGPVLNAKVERADESESTWLTLVHLVTADVFEKKEREPLKLGESFTGTVYAETGVAPANRGCLIMGNLICGHINKRKIDKGLKAPEEGVTVRYAAEVLPNMLKAGKRPLWSVEVLGTPLPPPPPTN